ncbi:MAG: hypothetical protein ABIC40_06470 [bacterium]
MRITHVLLVTLLGLALFGLACSNTKPAPAGKTGDNTKPATHEPATQPKPQTPAPVTVPVTTDAGTTQSGLAPVPGDTSGTTTVTALPPEWPADVPIMEGLTLVSAVPGPRDPVLIINVGAKGSLSINEVQEFYSKLKGWELDKKVPLESKPDYRSFKMIKGNENLGVTIRLEAGVTQLTLQYMSQKPVSPSATPPPSGK